MSTGRFDLFVSLLFASAAALSACGAADAPVLRFGVMSDTHVNARPESCDRVRAALKLFREKGVAVVINNGDIANRFDPAAYRAYRQVFDEVYAQGPKPREIYAYAWHDAYGYLDRPRAEAVSVAPQAFAAVRENLKAPHGHTAEFTAGGYAFLVMPQFTGHPGFLSWEDYEAKVAAACRANPDKPVFVVDHVPPRGTVFNSVRWGCARSREILGRHPQVVLFSGHTHGSLRSDLFIWQGDFTVVNAGCLYGWDGLLAGSPMPVPGGVRTGYDKQEFGVLTVEVHPDRMLVRRWDVRDGREIGADRPWSVPLPFDASRAPYRRDRMSAATPTPAFAPGAKVSVEPVMKKGVFSGFAVEFPDSAKGAETYRITAARKDANGGWTDCAVCELYSGFHLREEDRRPTLKYGLYACHFAPSADYRVSVAPMNAFHATGAAISTEVTTPAAFEPATPVWSCGDPMHELTFAAGGGERCSAGADGLYALRKTGSARLILPDGLFKGPKGAKLRLTVDVRTVCSDDNRQPTIRLSPRTRAAKWPRIEAYNGFGDVRSLRAFDVTLDGTATPCDLEIWECGGGKVRFEGLRLDRIGAK